MKPLIHALKCSALASMLFAASCGVGAAPGLSNAAPSSNGISSGTGSTAPTPTYQPQANTTRTPSGSLNRAPATYPSTSPSTSDATGDTLQQQRQQSGEQMIQERKGQAADTN